MDWSNEKYVRLYTRDTKTWMLIGWKGQAVFGAILRKVDRAGILDDIFNGEDLVIVLANGMPADFAQDGIDALVQQKVIKITDAGILIPNFIEAQEATMSNAERCRKYRETRRDRARATHFVSDEKQSMSRPTRSDMGRHEATRGDTPSLLSLPSDPSLLSDPSQTSKKSARARHSYSKEFEEFFKEYPRNDNKWDAYKAYDKARKTGILPSNHELVCAVRKQRTWETWKKGIIPHASTWLNKRRWEDTEPPTKNGNGAAPKSRHQREMDLLKQKYIEAKQNETERINNN